jgi:branched-chain amino acid transport system ATP-binding protein
MTMALLEVHDLHASYGAIRALRGIRFHVDAGEVVTLIGANGAGKSTTLNTLSGLMKPTQGRILFDGQDITGWRGDRVAARGLIQVPEGRQVIAPMTVYENLQLGAFTRRDAEVSADLEQMFERFPRLRERRDQKAGSLSGGEQQMLAIGRALMARPRLLLLDEPSLGLAPIIVREIFAIIRELHASGVTILLVEQNAHMALQAADRGYVMETGSIHLSGPGAELLHDDRVRQAYLG